MLFLFGTTASLTFHPGSGGHLVGTAGRWITFYPAGPFSEQHWGAIAVHSPKVRMEYVQVTGGGNTCTPEKANIIAFEPMILKNSAIEDSLGWGLLKRASDTTDYLSTNRFTGNASGAVGTLP